MDSDTLSNRKQELRLFLRPTYSFEMHFRQEYQNENLLGNLQVGLKSRLGWHNCVWLT